MHNRHLEGDIVVLKFIKGKPDSCDGCVFDIGYSCHSPFGCGPDLIIVRETIETPPTTGGANEP